MHSAPQPIIYFYRKHACHLCADMARELAAFQQQWRVGKPFEIVERYIEDNPRWHARYHAYVPTLVIARQEICHYFFDADEVKAALSGTAS